MSKDTLKNELIYCLIHWWEIWGFTGVYFILIGVIGLLSQDSLRSPFITLTFSILLVPLLLDLSQSAFLAVFSVRGGKTEYPLVYFAVAAGIGFSIQEDYLI